MSDKPTAQPDTDHAADQPGGSGMSRHDWHELITDDAEFTENLEVLMTRARRERQRLGLTQSALARRLDVSQSRISDIETGDLKKAEVQTLARYLRALGFRLRLDAEPTG
jgi:predicted transcriptional regulator